ncbi:MAG: polysaccharide deacetylase family protein [Eggerthellaceae bacterium]|nr:polysaccharide deacetylase family protein [Eggerthellaceae bacterium]
MTNSNQPPRRPARRQPTRRSTTPRTSVPSARDELERERELYSQHDPTASFMHERVQNKPAGQERGASSAFPAYAGAGNDHIAHSRVATNQPAQTNQGHTANSNMSNVSAWDQHASASASQRMPRVEGQRPNMQGSQRMPRMQQNGNEQARPSRRAANSQRGQRPSAQASQRMPRVEGQRPSAAQRQQRPVRRGAAASQPSQSMRVQAAQPQQSQPSQQIPVVQNMRGNDPSAYSRAKYQRTKEGAQKASPTNASTYQAARYLGNNNYAPKQKADFFTRGSLIAVAVVVVLAIVGIFAFNNWMGSKPVEVTLNGDQVTISGAERSVGGLLDNNVVSVTPGNYVAVDGSTIRQGEGTRCTAKVNGNDTDDMGMHLNGGDKIEISNGTDIIEPYTDSEPQTLPHKTELKGVGAVHLYSNNAQDGEQVTRTGKESGITATVTTKEPIDNIVQYYNVNSNGDKVIALTFDDGPWDKQTDEILDILEQNDAKATFFTVGQCISGHEKELQRAASMGCEIGTHTWDHAEGSGEGVSLIKMSTDERKQEVQKGLEAIKNATGQEASTIFRCPGGNFDTSVATDLEGIVTAEIGWNVDTTDWKKPGADVIAQRIQSAGPGNIILMHDGGGDRSQTIEGLRQALPKLKEQGYSLITVQELLEKYPYQEGQTN